MEVRGLMESEGSESLPETGGPTSRSERKLVRGVHSKHVLAGMGRIFENSDREELLSIQPTVRRGWSRARELTLPLLSRVRRRGRKPSLASIGVGVSREEAERLYALSFETANIERFISHSWSAARLGKWLALCDVLHRHLAIGSALLWWLVTTLLAVSVRFVTGQPRPYPLAIITFVLMPAWLLFFLLVQNLEVVGSTCYLDKLCVHQFDDKLKLEGISALGDGLQVSRRLTILWSGDYFTRLWCIFEIAVFVASLKGDAANRRIEFQPLWLPPFLLGLLACNVLVVLGSAMLEGSPVFSALMFALGPYAGIGAFWVIANTVPALFICFLMRRKSLAVQSMLEGLLSFELDNTKATVESDRLLVYEQIRVLFGSTEEFEEYVRTEFHEAVTQAVGRPRLGEWAIVIFMPYAWFATVEVASISREAVEAQAGRSGFADFVFTSYCFHLSQWCIVYPAVLRGLNLAQHLSRSVTGCPALILDVVVYQSLNFVLNTGLTYMFNAPNFS